MFGFTRNYLRISDKKGWGFGFRSKLDAMFIQHDASKLHNSVYDAKYLKELFFETKRRIEATREYKGEVTLVLHKQTGKIHLSNCPSISYTSEENLETLDPAALYNGHEICQRCKKYISKHVKAPNKKKKKDTKIRIFEDKSVERLCKERDFRCNIWTGNISIETPCCTWIIQHDGENIWRIWHSNYHTKTGVKTRGYHLQHVKGRKDLVSVLDYIQGHDRKMVRRYQAQILNLQYA